MSNEYAFPGKAVYEEERGMTLRDWFAGQALTGIDAIRTTGGSKALAEMAYEVADAMLKEREK